MKPSTKSDSGDIVCPKCGQEQGAGYKQCQKCGTKFTSAVGAKKQKANFFLLAVLAVLIICICLAVALLLPPSYGPYLLLRWVPFRASPQEWSAQFPKGKTLDEFRTEAALWRGLWSLDVIGGKTTGTVYFRNDLFPEEHCAVTIENGRIVETKY